MTEELAASYRAAWPRLLAHLVRSFGRVELAEDCLQEACLRALAVEGLADPVGWISTTARRLVIDELRKEEVRERKAPLLAVGGASTSYDVHGPTTGDDRLDLLLLACDPLLPSESRMPLALRFVLGARTESIADAFLVPHPTMSARLTRAKRRLDRAGRRLGPPDPQHRGDVLGVISLLYTLGHTALAGEVLGVDGDRATALELARAAVGAWPDEDEAAGLLALLLLTEARHPGRTDADGRPVTLRDADRASWDRAMIGEGLALATKVLPTMGRFALAAGIAGLHSSAPRWEETDWPAVVRLYDRVIERYPSPGARIARAVASGYGPGGPESALDELEALDPGTGATARQHAAARADLLRLAGRSLEARAAYLQARALERNAVLRDYLDQALAALP
ncbi:MAG TPA: DUF6596 domain-containing protein [Nocardioides sp.]|nr:DUF6596 domain-containing protein [Nocardioides sp.]